MNTHTQQRLSQLAPPVQGKFVAMDGILVLQNIVVEITQGLRTPAEQRAEFAQGRQALEQVNALRAAVNLAPITEAENVIVTHAIPGESWHEYGCALDYAPFVDGEPVWDLSSPLWPPTWQAARSVGFSCGVDWSEDRRDPPHLQYTGRFPVTPDGTAWRLLQNGSFSAVWEAAFDMKKPAPQTPTDGAQEA